MTRSHLSLSLYAALIFGGGIAVGALGDRLWTSAPVAATTGRPISPEEWRRQYLEEMRARVHITDDQAARLNAILDESRILYNQVKEKYHPEMRAIHEAQVAKVKAMLEPAQREEYQKVLDERAAKATKAKEAAGAASPTKK
jgi:hypothetical protein